MHYLPFITASNGHPPLTSPCTPDRCKLSHPSAFCLVATFCHRLMLAAVMLAAGVAVLGEGSLLVCLNSINKQRRSLHH